MAIDFSKYNFFSRLDARARIFVLVAGFLGIVLLIYLAARFFAGTSPTTGPSRVATAPAGVQSIQGGQLNPEYYRAVQQANTQYAQQAQITGGSAIPTMVNLGGQAGCIICSDQNANVKTNLDSYVRQGKIDPNVAADLQALADKNVSEAEYAAKLADLVRQGKLTPEQARELLEQYRKQHQNRLLQDSAKLMDNMIKNGQLPLDAANQLLSAQKNNVSPSQYAAMLQDLVRQGKISPSAAQQLLAQYAQQRAREIVDQSIAILQDMSRQGQITPDVLKELIEMENNLIPVSDFATALQKYLAAGKLVPAVSDKILEEYKSQKAQIGPTQSINSLIQKAEAEAYQELADLLKAGQITQDVASQIAGMIQNDVSLEQFTSAIAYLVQQKKLTPQIAQLKIADYTKVKGLRDMAARLAELQGNNASPTDYAEQLKKAVQAGLITPDEAARLMQDYQAMSSRAPLSQIGEAGASGSKEFAELANRVREGGGTTTSAVTPADFVAAQAQAVQVTTQDQSAVIQGLMTAMSTQAQQLIVSWQPPVMLHRDGVAQADKSKGDLVPPGKGGPTSGPGGTTTTTTIETGAPLIKAGTIIFGVLDTAVNSDYPSTPVLVTIVEGKYKGARLLGKLQTQKGVAGQLDRVSLNFTLMNRDDWAKSKPVTAFAIDPDTARTVMASSVNYHWLQRFGAIMATSFLQGYASAITNSASTTTTGIFGTSTAHPELSPSQKLAVGLGQVGQTLGAAVQNYVNIPPTVRVDSGVGLGILFMADVT